jgi:hypothetical protein
MASDLVIERRTPLPVSAEAAFAWHARPGALERLTPPWLRIEVLERAALVDGSTARLRIHCGPFVIHWTAQHVEVEPDRGFSDFQLQGPFDRWKHTHRFEPAPGGTCVLHERIEADLPLGMRPGRGYVAHELEHLLAYRHAVTAADLAMHAGARSGPLHVAITGASGFIGSMLVPLLTTGGHRVTRLVRHSPGEGEIQWDPAGRGLDPAALRGIDAVIHLAGENIAARWSDERKRAVLESRRTGTRLLVEALTHAKDGPRTLVSTSAIGFYGDRGEELLTEEGGSGSGFLPEVCRAWEAATEPAEAAGIRVVRVRIGLPLSPAGGMLQRMLLPFRLGLGGRMGSGEQWMSWLSADDLLGVFHRALTDATLRGAVNAVAPNPVRNSDFAKELAKTLRRPAFLPVPATPLRLVFGQMAEETILASARVRSEVLELTGYRFRHPTLREALEHVLGRSA